MLILLIHFKISCVALILYTKVYLSVLVCM